MAAPNLPPVDTHPCRRSRAALPGVTLSRRLGGCRQKVGIRHVIRQAEVGKALPASCGCAGNEQVYLERACWVEISIARKKERPLRQGGRLVRVQERQSFDQIRAEMDRPLPLPDFDPVEDIAVLPIVAEKRIGAVGGEENDLIVDLATCSILVVPGLAEDVYADTGGGKQRDIEVDEDRVGICGFPLHGACLAWLVGNLAIANTQMADRAGGLQ